MQRPGRIYLKIFVPFAAVLMLALLYASWVASTLLASALTQRLDEQMSHALDVLATGVLPLTEDLLRRTSELLRADIVLLDTEGEVALSTTPIDADLANVLRVEAERNGSLREYGQLRISMERVAVGRDGRYNHVAAITNLSDLRDAARDTAWLLALSAAAAAVLLAIAGHYLARTITRPILELSDMAKRIAAGNRDVRVALEQSDEIGALADSLNEMAGRLDAYEHELKEQSRLSALGEMAARVAHEIRNPLTAIKLRLQMLAETGGPNETVDRLLREIQRLELIVASALTVARPQRLNQSRADLNAVLDDVLALVETQLTHQRLHLEKRFGQLPIVPVDADAIKQILFNLINNAAAAQPRGGRIRVSSRLCEGADTVEVTVEDAGPGMPAADAQASSQETRGVADARSGAVRLGLGLKLCRELVDLHRGTLRVDRSPELCGARFAIVLPVSIIP